MLRTQPTATWCEISKEDKRKNAYVLLAKLPRIITEIHLKFEKEYKPTYSRLMIHCV
jgi:hypothetical protein